MDRENSIDRGGSAELSHPHAPTALPGISVVICTYNGASRLPQALAHLARQETGGRIQWEVIVVDNACTDNSAEVARRCWPPQHEAALRVVSEPRLGLRYAKERGLFEARHELVAFVDDDSWVNPRWIRAATQACLEHTDAGAICGVIEPVFEGDPPRWFEPCGGWFGVWTGIEQPCDITEMIGGLCGDGMILRKSAWQDLRDKGFRFRSIGNQGDAFNGGEDEELSVALRLAGWRLWCDPGLRLQQFLPAGKLSWYRLRQRARNAGVSSVDLDSYYLALPRPNVSLKLSLKAAGERLPAQWLWRALWSSKALARRPVALALMPFFALEGREQVLVAESALSRIRRLCHLRGSYDRMIRQTREIRWR